MNFKVGDHVTRDSYDNDIVFVIIGIKDNIALLKGFDLRLIADSPLSDLKISEEREDDFIDNIELDIDINRMDRGNDSEFFYLPPKILHLDGDSDYLDKCLKFYKKNRVMAYGRTVLEKDLEEKVIPLLTDIKPDILIVTGHDSFNKKNNDINDMKNYKNSFNFIKAVKAARKYEKSHDKLLIIAGACQSNYEELIKAGADFASSPKRVNIHALDPAIIATTLSLTERNREVDLIKLLEKTKYGKDGMGGLKVNGLMYVGYPR
ncbi:MAG: sporulation peptidase YabG [Firmicutes bacterium]|nr:sporulation peptidase YabG [Bacillota bacterium]